MDEFREISTQNNKNSTKNMNCARKYGNKNVHV
jgi:hypothetical protein